MYRAVPAGDPLWWRWRVTFHRWALIACNHLDRQSCWSSPAVRWRKNKQIHLPKEKTNKIQSTHLIFKLGTECDSSFLPLHPWQWFWPLGLVDKLQRFQRLIWSPEAGRGKRIKRERGVGVRPQAFKQQENLHKKTGSKKRTYFSVLLHTFVLFSSASPGVSVSGGYATVT